MSIFFKQFYKKFVIFAFAYFSSGCLYSPIYNNNNAFEELRRGSQIATFAWRTNSNNNTVIRDDAGHHVATIFTLRYDHKGKIGVYLNKADGSRESILPFEDPLTAKEWIISRAPFLGISLARE